MMTDRNEKMLSFKFNGHKFFPPPPPCFTFSLFSHSQLKILPPKHLQKKRQHWSILILCLGFLVCIFLLYVGYHFLISFFSSFFLVVNHGQAVMTELNTAQAEIARLLEQLRLTDRYLSYISLFVSLCSVCNSALFSCLSSQQASDRDGCLFW